nr:hypothetical protein [uncultured Haemophilus sp.]
MYYLTNHNFGKLLNGLYLELPMNYAEAYVNYYSEYRLASFDLDLHFFTKDEARALVIADKLVKDIKFVATEVQIARCNIEQQKWVEKIVLPAFHSHENCQLLSSDFENFLIPESCPESRREEYRAYFLENKDRYGNAENKIEPIVFCRLLQSKFNLSEALGDLVEHHFSKTNYDNSEVAEFNHTLDFEKEITNIQAMIDSFTGHASKFKPREVRSAFYRQNLMHLTEEERSMIATIQQERKQIYFRIINFYFKKLFKEGADIPLNILKLSGFQPCKGCCKHLLAEW